MIRIIINEMSTFGCYLSMICHDSLDGRSIGWPRLSTMLLAWLAMWQDEEVPWRVVWAGYGYDMDTLWWQKVGTDWHRNLHIAGNEIPSLLRQWCCMRQVQDFDQHLLKREDEYGILFVIYMIIYVLIWYLIWCLVWTRDNY